MNDPKLTTSVLEIIKKIEAGSSLRSAAGMTKNDLEAIYASGYILFNQGKYENALKLFALLLIYEQSDRRFFIAVGTCFQKLNIPEKAIEYLGLANFFDVTDPEPAVQIAECLLAMKRSEEAHKLLKTIHAEFGKLSQYQEMMKKVEAMLFLAKA